MRAAARRKKEPRGASATDDNAADVRTRPRSLIQTNDPEWSRPGRKTGGYLRGFRFWLTFRGVVTVSHISPSSAPGGGTPVPEPAQRRSRANQEHDACGQEREPEDGDKPTPDAHEPPLEWGVA